MFAPRKANTTEFNKPSILNIPLDKKAALT